jgi:hypothetical protein
MAFILKAQLWLRRLSAHLHIVASRHSRCYTVSTFSVEASQAQTQGRWCESIPFYIGVSMLLFFLLFAPCSQRHICSDLSCHISITRLFHKVKGSYSSVSALIHNISRSYLHIPRFSPMLQVVPVQAATSSKKSPHKHSSSTLGSQSTIPAASFQQSSYEGLAYIQGKRLGKTYWTLSNTSDISTGKSLSCDQRPPRIDW